MKFSRKDQRTLLYIVGVLLIIAVYFLYFTNKQSELEEAQNEVDKLDHELAVLREYETSMKTYEREIKKYHSAIEEVTEEFPLDVKEENVFMYGRELELATGIGITGITISDPTLMDTVGSGERQKKLYLTQAQMVFGGYYSQVKDVINMTMNFPLKRNIVALTLTSDEETGVLIGNITLNLYNIKGNGQVYDKPYTGIMIPERKPDIFE